MKAYDYYAVVYQSLILCVDCLPRGVKVDDPDVHPIFANSEWDCPPVCDKCGRVHEYMTILQTT